MIQTIVPHGVVSTASSADQPQSLTSRQKRFRIAVFTGWTQLDETMCNLVARKPGAPTHTPADWDTIPDYDQDPNAMAEAVKMLDAEQRSVYTASTDQRVDAYLHAIRHKWATLTGNRKTTLF